MPNEVTLPGLGLSPRNIFCIGRNYAEHAKELNNAVPTEPVVFLKPVSALCFSGSRIMLPPQSHEVHYEAEVVVAIGRSGKNVPASKALELVAGYAVGIDVTARDLQDAAKKKALPWVIAKGFDTFAPVSVFITPSRVGDPAKLDLELRINGELRQKANTSQLLFPIAELIGYLSTVFTLAPGDLIFTGTPKGVGPLKECDQLVATLGQGLCSLDATVSK